MANDIPQDIMNAIEQQVEAYPLFDEFYRPILKAFAEFGYELKLEQKDEEIALLDAREVAWGNRVEQLKEEIEGLKNELKESHQKEYSLDFVIWYSGMDKDSVEQGYRQYLFKEE